MINEHGNYYGVLELGGLVGNRDQVRTTIGFWLGVVSGEWTKSNFKTKWTIPWKLGVLGIYIASQI